MQQIEASPQDNFPFVMFDTHVFKDRVIFTLPMRATMETLVPLARELLGMPLTRTVEAKVEVDDGGELVISITATSD